MIAFSRGTRLSALFLALALPPFLSVGRSVAGQNASEPPKISQQDRDQLTEAEHRLAEAKDSLKHNQLGRARSDIADAGDLIQQGGFHGGLDSLKGAAERLQESSRSLDEGKRDEAGKGVDEARDVLHALVPGPSGRLKGNSAKVSAERPDSETTEEAGQAEVDESWMKEAGKGR